MSNDDFSGFLGRMVLIIKNACPRIIKNGARFVKTYLVLVEIGSRLVRIPLEPCSHSRFSQARSDLPATRPAYSHSIVLGGLELMS